MVAVWCPDWPVVAAGVAAGVPAVVLHANRVVARSPAAAADGVVIGQRRRQAQQRCPTSCCSTTTPTVTPGRSSRSCALSAGSPPSRGGRAGVAEPRRRGRRATSGGDERLAEQVVAAVRSEAATDVGGRDRRWSFRRRRRRPARPGADRRPTRHVGGLPRPAPGRLAAPSSARPTPSWSACSRGWAWPVSATSPRCPPATSWQGSARPGATPIAWPAVSTTALPAAPSRRRAAGRADLRRPCRAEPSRSCSSAGTSPTSSAPLVAAEGQGGCTRSSLTAETEHGERSERAWYRAAGMSAAAMVERVRWQLDGWTSSASCRRGSCCCGWRPTRCAAMTATSCGCGAARRPPTSGRRAPLPGWPG